MSVKPVTIIGAHGKLPKRLSFSQGNSKLSDSIALFSLPAGHACPFASLCLAKADRKTGKITDGLNSAFRCYATATEAMFKKVRESRWSNFEALKAAKTVNGMAALIGASLPAKSRLVRMHQSGDFFSQTYFDAWLQVARGRPGVIFYAYTKALPFWVARIDSIPSNMRLVASIGGRRDDLIAEYNLRSVKVVYSAQEAVDLKLPIDHDDSHVWNYRGSFAILLHGTQKAGSQASKDWQTIKSTTGGYKADYFKATKN